MRVRILTIYGDHSKQGDGHRICWLGIYRDMSSHSSSFIYRSTDIDVDDEETILTT
jgi:hypothetical protein